MCKAGEMRDEKTVLNDCQMSALVWDDGVGSECKGREEGESMI